jgi:hypothetical protein
VNSRRLAVVSVSVSSGCQWSVVSGQWSVVSGQWSVVSGQWSVVSGQLAVVGFSDLQACISFPLTLTLTLALTLLLKRARVSKRSAA